MEKTSVLIVELELIRLKERIEDLKKSQSLPTVNYSGSLETAAVRRASMDLTRALAKMRRYK